MSQLRSLDLEGPAGGAPNTRSYLVYVRFKRLPFYDVLAELHGPVILTPKNNSSPQENSYVFKFTAQQVREITSSMGSTTGSQPELAVEVQLRFCLLETSYEQEDFFPRRLRVKVNDKLCPLPRENAANDGDVKSETICRPINIISMCKLSPIACNRISVTWLSDYGREYAMVVYLVRKLPVATLLQRLKATSMGSPEYTKAMIKEMLRQDGDSEIAPMKLRWSLVCPLGKMRMSFPCRSLACSHLQCFDASIYLQMNEKKPTWICPVCRRAATFSSLIIDGLFTEITTKAPSDCCEVQFHEDGGWSPFVAKREIHPIDRPSSSIASTSSLAPVESSSREQSEQPSKRPRVVVIDLTGCSSDEEEDGGRTLMPTPGPQRGMTGCSSEKGDDGGRSSDPTPGAQGVQPPLVPRTESLERQSILSQNWQEVALQILRSAIPEGPNCFSSLFDLVASARDCHND